MGYADDDFTRSAQPCDAGQVVEHVVSAGWEPQHTAQVLGLLRDVRM